MLHYLNLVIRFQKDLMRVCTFLSFINSMLLFIFSVHISMNTMWFYYFTLPFIIVVGCLSLISITGFIIERYRFKLLWVISILYLFLPVLCSFALHRWPGGDDGTGFTWGIYIGWWSYLSLILSLLIIIVCIIDIYSRFKNRTTA